MDPKTQFSLDALKAARLIQLNFIKQFNYEQLTTIPEGFSNSILWNFGHIVVAQHLLSYGLSNGELKIERELISKYKRGSSGKENVSEEELEALVKLSHTLIDGLISDYSLLKKNTFNTFVTGLNVELNTIDESIEFNNTHEGIHLGMMMSIAKQIKK